MLRFTLPALGLALLCSGGCARVPAPAAMPFAVVTDVHHTMELILYPAADKIWDSAGFIITADGEQDLSPTSEEGWHEVESAAAVVAETGNLLMLPGRSQGDDWVGYAIGLRETGKLAMQAATAQDAEALFAAGGHIYQVCKACHDQYWIDTDD